MKKTLILFSAALLIAQGCKKEETNTQSSGDVQKDVLNSLSQEVYFNSYISLSDKTSKLYSDVQAFVADPTDDKLSACRQDWKDAREVWENTEAWLFGPVATESIDPRIDTWPVDFVRLDSVLNSSNTINNQYIDGLEESLKGFHPLEYMLFGVNGNKKASDFTSRQKDYLLALAENIKILTNELSHSWSVSGGNYTENIIDAGNNNIYPTRLSAYEEMVNAMIGICEEVADGKIGEVFTHLDSMGEESPFAKNSITDFTNNIRGVRNVYLGTFGNKDVAGLEDFVRTYNLSLDTRIKQKADQAIAALNNITDPFGKAIFTQPVQVQNAIDAINALKSELEDGLLPLVQLKVK